MSSYKDKCYKNNPEDNVETCFCSDDLCNGATNPVSALLLALFCTVLTAFFK